MVSRLPDPGASRGRPIRAGSPLVIAVINTVAELVVDNQRVYLARLAKRVAGTENDGRERQRLLLLADWRSRRYPCRWLAHSPLAGWAGMLWAMGPLRSAADAGELGYTLRCLDRAMSDDPAPVHWSGVHPELIAHVVRRAAGVAERASHPEGHVTEFAMAELVSGEFAEIAHHVPVSSMREDALDLVEQLIAGCLPEPEFPVGDAAEAWLGRGWS
ncbi:hypothetical protein BAY61_05550 [Prauserella marina]|uniref:Uncharacterized protein n=1 Tax=Prauserella marina TaxID=530584 RepID=A0A222VLB0_9PSEU|nr:hypothetical protein [Prauserella marina]ASR34543.1 hypothetical protein BAY61_05550 [Prauserella marina]PWV85848.1 hypothetical protein DES30_1011878 [Prauserella marina]SDC44021.1 hypothetical protein SAMN05421630_102114 [Prauserella marina]